MTGTGVTAIFHAEPLLSGPDGIISVYFKGKRQGVLSMGAGLDFKGFMKGARAALPIVAGYLPLGFACGVIADGAGMTVFQAGLMSALVFAGAAQYIAVGMIGAFMPPISVITTVFIVNLRHLLYTSALYPYVSSWSPLRKALFAFQITDETFAVQSSLLSKGGVGYSAAMGVNMISHGGWIAGNVLGALFGSVMENSGAFGFDFALPALFIALLAPQLTDRPRLFAAVTSGVLSLVFAASGFGGLVILAAVAGAGAGVFMTGRRHA